MSISRHLAIPTRTEGAGERIFSFNPTILDVVVFNLGPIDGRTFQNVLAKIDPPFNAFGVSLQPSEVKELSYIILLKYFFNF